MQPTNSSQLVHILQRTLNRVDPRLIGHGERVAILMHQILKQVPDISPRERSNLLLMGLLHDIGAYKTEDIDDMLCFERDGVWEHAAYGYLYLKLLSPLGELARPILFHHLAYQDYHKVSPHLDPQDPAGLIFMADRADMLLMQLNTDECLRWIRRHNGVRCTPYWTERFLAAAADGALLERLKGGQYEDLRREMIDNLTFAPDEIRQYLSTIAYSIDFHSEFMVLHTVTTVSVSQVLGKLVGVPEEEEDSLYYGALLHDLGKVDCPVDILEKPGKLTDTEMAVMKQHVSTTRDILEGYIDQEVVEIAARHHERQDGSGYPQGLPGQALTTAQRIVAVADVVSALVRRRSYKGAFDKETTLGILLRMKADGQFCGTVIDALLEHYDDVLATAERFGAPITATYEHLLKDYQVLLSGLPRAK